MTLADYLKPKVFERGIEKGIEEGFEKGKQDQSIEIAKILLLKGMDAEAVAEATNLSKVEMMKLLK